MRSGLLILILVILGNSQGNACSCANISTFCESVSDGSGIHSSYVIVLAEVDRKESDGMWIEVRDILFGQNVPSDIWLRKGNGADCLVNTDIFTPGGDYLFALWNYEDKYSLSICGVNWLEVKNGIVRGEIAPGIDKIDLDKLHTVMACLGLGSQLTSVAVMPNPAADELYLRRISPIEQPLQMVIYDMAGRQVYDQVIDLETREEHIVDVRRFAAGMYIVVIEIQGIRRANKVIVQSAL